MRPERDPVLAGLRRDAGFVHAVAGVVEHVLAITDAHADLLVVRAGGGISSGAPRVSPVGCAEVSTPLGIGRAPTVSR